MVLTKLGEACLGLFLTPTVDSFKFFVGCFLCDVSSSLNASHMLSASIINSSLDVLTLNSCELSHLET